MAVQIPAQAIVDAKAGAGELWEVVLAIAGPESSWRADAIGDCKLYKGGPIVPCTTPRAQPYSFGYLQMYTDGGLGDGHSAAELLDGPANFRLGAEYIRRRLAGGASLYAALSPWTTRDAAWALYQRIKSEGIEPVGSAVAPGPTFTGAGPLLMVALLGLLWLVLDSI